MKKDWEKIIKRFIGEKDLGEMTEAEFALDVLKATSMSVDEIDQAKKTLADKMQVITEWTKTFFKEVNLRMSLYIPKIPMGFTGLSFNEVSRQSGKSLCCITTRAKKDKIQYFLVNKRRFIYDWEAAKILLRNKKIPDSYAVLMDNKVYAITFSTEILSRLVADIGDYAKFRKAERKEIEEYTKRQDIDAKKFFLQFLDKDKKHYLVISHRDDNFYTLITQNEGEPSTRKTQLKIEQLLKILKQYEIDSLFAKSREEYL